MQSRNAGNDLSGTALCVGRQGELAMHRQADRMPGTFSAVLFSSACHRAV